MFSFDSGIAPAAIEGVRVAVVVIIVFLLLLVVGLRNPDEPVIFIHLFLAHGAGRAREVVGLIVAIDYSIRRTCET